MARSGTSRPEIVLGPSTGPARPRLLIHRPSHNPQDGRRDGPGRGVRAVVLVLHGGRAQSTSLVQARHLSVLRVAVLARAIRQRVSAEERNERADERSREAQDTVHCRLLFGLRGWNGHGAPRADATWALAELRQRFGPVPVVLVGHSMGGRTAVTVADFPTVVGVVGLAAWLPPDEVPVGQLAGRALVLVHGTHDTTVPASQSVAFAEAAQPVAASVALTLLEGADHAMLRQAGTWHRLASDAVLRMVNDG